jgi:peroxiredoxin
MTRLQISSVLALLITLGLSPPLPASTGQERAQAAGATLIGTQAPALKLKTIDGQLIDLGSLYGHKAVYLKFWATWCVPCRQQMPHFEHTYEHAGHDLVVIAINAGFNDTLDDVKAYRRTVGLKMPIVIDDGRLADALNLRVTPQHVVIGRDGKITYIGHLVDDRLEAALTSAQVQPITAVAAVAKVPARSQALAVGASIPSKVLKAADGSDIPLRDPTATRSTVLMFMSPWCESYLEKSRPQRSAACKRAREQSEQLAGDSHLRWVGIASGLWASAEDLADYSGEKHVTVPLSLDETGALFRQFGVTEVPTMIVVDPNGRISARIDDVSDHLAGQLTGVGQR